jgi:ABC-type uncharacterized transport system permease subunit
MRHSTPNRTARTIATLTAVALSLTAAGVAALCAALFPRHVPTPQDPHVVDVVFESGPVVWAARLLLVSAAFVLAVGGAFVVASVVVRTRNGDWLKRAGPFEVSETSVTELEDEVHFWRSAARDCYDELNRVHKLDEEADKLQDPVLSEDDYDKL